MNELDYKESPMALAAPVFDEASQRHLEADSSALSGSVFTQTFGEKVVVSAAGPDALQRIKTFKRIKESFEHDVAGTKIVHAEVATGFYVPWLSDLTPNDLSYYVVIAVCVTLLTFLLVGKFWRKK